MIQENAKPAAPVQHFVPLPLPFKPYYDANGITIYNADCRKILPWMERFDLLLTDPPYGIGADKKKAHRSIRDNPDWENSDWDAKRPARWVLESMCEFAKTQIIWGGNYFSDSLPPSQCWLVWDKGQREFSLADAELAWTNMPKAVRKFKWRWNGMLQENMGDKKETRVHPTQKPTALMRWCLSLVPEAKTVLDPYMGSGTTLVACKAEGRHAIGIDISEQYCESAAKRLSQGVLF